MNKDIKEISNMVEHILSLQQIVINDLNREIDYIIKNNIIDDNKVEHLFDQIINLFPNDEVENLLKKLGRYYYDINKETVEFYINTYIEMYYDDEDIKKLKINR